MVPSEAVVRLAQVPTPPLYTVKTVKSVFTHGSGYAPQLQVT